MYVVSYYLFYLFLPQHNQRRASWVFFSVVEASQGPRKYHGFGKDGFENYTKDVLLDTSFSAGAC